MANKKKVEQEEQIKEEERKEQLYCDHEAYVSRINARILSGEKLTVKSFDDWVRKAVRKDNNGNEIEIQVAGDSGETRNQKFLRLGKSRIRKTLDDMDLLINLSSPQYEAFPENVEKMINILKLKVQDIEKSFKAYRSDNEIEL